MMRRLMLPALLLSLTFTAFCQETAVQAYTGFYTGRIIPTPQEVDYQDETWELADAAAQTTTACILISPQATDAEKLAAREIAARIGHLSGGVELPIHPETEPPPGARVFIAVGRESASRFIAEHVGACGIATPEQPEGYAIASYRHEKGFGGVILSGHDPAGAYLAAQSLVQMMERVEDKVVLHAVRVRDWPTYRLRSFKTGGGFGPETTSMQMGLWAPFAKFNCYNICYTTLGRDKWKDPEPGYREHVQTLAAHMRARGLDVMPFVNPYYLWREHIVTADEGDLEKLFEACRLGPEAGATRVMLCLDDFASEPKWSGPELYVVRSERDRERWGDDLAAVNVHMVNDLARRMRAAYPDVILYVVLPYYWNPGGSYREAGEAYLRAVGEGLDPEVRVVWTGPQVRSAIITRGQTEHYQGLLGGREVMLWDNTIYMHHNPPHYFLDTFRTQYPERFWELMSGEVHLNAGGGEAYKAGLLAAADYLWNPAAYDPEASLRNALGAVAGPQHVDDLLAFRDAFYVVYDDYALQLGRPAQFLERVRQLETRPFDEEGIREFMEALDTKQSLAERIAAACPNEGLVAEVQERVQMFAAYREAFELLATLPPMTEEDEANIAPNPSVEEVAGNRPAGWGAYTGAGRCTLGVGEGRDGGRCGKLTATGLHDWGDGRTSINVALMIGDTNGFSGENAPEVLPLHRYHFSFRIKGDAPRVVVSVTTWDASGSRESRGGARVKLDPFAAPDEWTFISGSFTTPVNAQRAALKIGIEGYDHEGGGLGEICVDDVYVGRSRARAAEGAPQQ